MCFSCTDSYLHEDPIELDQLRIRMTARQFTSEEKDLADKYLLTQLDKYVSTSSLH